MNCQYVMFSPVGTTDPISNYHDGAVLHIARKFRPSKIFLYLSKEMCELHERDDRYRKALALLGERLGTKFSVEFILRPDLADVHIFDYFYAEFEAIIKDIAEKNPGHVVLLNVSSGTPAMKGALQTLAAFLGGETFIPVQVSTPEAGANPRRDDFRAFSLSDEWECDEDNSERFRDRTEVSTTLALNVRLKKEIIARHIEARDYHAALDIAVEIEPYISRDAMRLLEAANARVMLDVSGVTKALAGTAFKVIPIEDSSLRNMAEYLLSLELKLRRAEYSDFMRGVTPLMADLFEQYLTKKLGVDMRRYCAAGDKQNGKLRPRRSLLERDERGRRMLETLDVEFNGYDDAKYFSSAQLLAIIRSDSAPSDTLEKLRNVETKCRNLAAHEIVSVTREWIKSECGYTPEDILRLLFDAAEMAGITRAKIAGSYDRMNDMILSALDGRPDGRRGV